MSDGCKIKRIVDLIQQFPHTQVLEQIARPKARDVLKKLSAGATAARETREAKESLERLARKTK
jgi:hypothetical protein